MEVEKNKILAPEEQTLRAEAELQKIIEQRGKPPGVVISPVEKVKVTPPFLPISKVDLRQQEPMEWNQDHSTRQQTGPAKSLQQRRGGPRHSPMRISIPIQHDERKEKTGGAKKLRRDRKKKINFYRQLQLRDYVSGRLKYCHKNQNEECPAANCNFHR